MQRQPWYGAHRGCCRFGCSRHPCPMPPPALLPGDKGQQGGTQSSWSPLTSLLGFTLTPASVLGQLLAPGARYSRANPRGRSAGEGTERKQQTSASPPHTTMAGLEPHCRDKDGNWEQLQYPEARTVTCKVPEPLCARLNDHGQERCHGWSTWSLRPWRCSGDMWLWHRGRWFCDGTSAAAEGWV